MSPSSRLRKNASAYCRDAAREIAARPSGAQRQWLLLGMRQTGGRLPLFTAEGREVPRRTVEACIAHGWAEPWISNPIRPGTRLCKLTAAGRAALERPLPETPAATAKAAD